MINKQSKLTRILSSITLATALLFPINTRAAEPKLTYSPQTIENQSQTPDYFWVLGKPTQSSSFRNEEPAIYQENPSEQNDLDIKNIQNLYGKNPEELEKAKLDLIKKRALENVRDSVNGLDFITGLRYNLL